MNLATWVFRAAGVYGLLVTIPLVFGESMMGVKQPEFYYGFVFLNICWQFVYLYVSSDPARYRPMMLPALLAKASGAAALTWLFLQDRVAGQWVAAAVVDAAFAVLFLVAHRATRELVRGRPA